MRNRRTVHQRTELAAGGDQREIGLGVASVDRQDGRAWDLHRAAAPLAAGTRLANRLEAGRQIEVIEADERRTGLAKRADDPRQRGGDRVRPGMQEHDRPVAMRERAAHDGFCDALHGRRGVPLVGFDVPADVAVPELGQRWRPGRRRRRRYRMGTGTRGGDRPRSRSG